ncbi:MAG: AraC family transcriptional regulator, partial [Peptostreptococcaceae bacterium]
MLNLKELKEFTNHGSSLFPLNVYDCYFEVGDLVVPYHWHDEIEIIYVEKGCIGITINTETKILNEGEILFINSYDLHQINRVNASPCRHYALVFSPQSLSFELNDHSQIKLIKPLLNKTLKLPQTINPNEIYCSKIVDLFLEIIDEYSSKKAGWYINIKSCLYKIFSIFIRENLLLELDTDLKNSSYKDEQIKKALEFIHNNYSNKIYIDEIARTVGLNSQYFCRFFKSVIGKTPIEYINRYRINMANEYLQTEDIPITDVCFRVGFENQSYFIKLFKKYNNMTP